MGSKDVYTGVGSWEEGVLRLKGTLVSEVLGVGMNQMLIPKTLQFGRVAQLIESFHNKHGALGSILNTPCS